MEDEKKPKRPRIGVSATPAASAENGEARYEKINYSGERNSYSQGDRMQRPYQSRPYQQRPNSYGQQRPYQQRPYQPRPQQNDAAGSDSDAENSQMQHGHTQQYGQRQNNYGQQRPYQQRPNGYGQQRQNNYGQQRPYQQRPNSYGQQRQNNYGQQRPYQQRPYQQRPMQQGAEGEGGYRPRTNNYGQRPNGYGQQRPYNNNRPGGHQQRPGGYGQQRPQYGQQRPGQGGYKRPGQNRFQQRPGKQFIPRPKQIDYVIEDIDPNEPIRLNKYMANAGVCSRREADEHITAGLVKVNGEVVTELGTKITRNDVVEYDGKAVVPERRCYVLLNKPKDCVTTSDDPNGRTTVLDLVKNACNERIYPVGRLDRNTTGVLLLTNDGDLASKLTHPKFVKKKIYHVWTDKDIEEEDMQRIADVIELEDGEIHADAISYVNDSDRNQAGIEIHSGRNRIVRRIFEALGYRVTKLDRVYFAGLTKKNLPRGRWRYLTQEEVDYLRQGTFE